MGATKGQADVLGMCEPNPSTQEADADDSVELMNAVRMKVCDFAQFCHFLDSMTMN